MVARSTTFVNRTEYDVCESKSVVSCTVKRYERVENVYDIHTSINIANVSSFQIFVVYFDLFYLTTLILASSTLFDMHLSITVTKYSEPEPHRSHTYSPPFPCEGAGTTAVPHMYVFHTKLKKSRHSSKQRKYTLHRPR